MTEPEEQMGNEDDKNIQAVAQLWCMNRHKHKEMDVRLAKDMSRLLDDKDLEIASLKKELARVKLFTEVVPEIKILKDENLSQQREIEKLREVVEMARHYGFKRSTFYPRLAQALSRLEMP